MGCLLKFIYYVLKHCVVNVPVSSEGLGSFYMTRHATDEVWVLYHFVCIANLHIKN